MEGNFITAYNDLELYGLIHGLGIFDTFYKVLINDIGIFPLIGMVLLINAVVFMFEGTEDREKNDFFTGKIWLIFLQILSVVIFTWNANLKIRTVKSVQNANSRVVDKVLTVREGDYTLEKAKVFKLHSNSIQNFGKDNWLSSNGMNYSDKFGDIDYIKNNTNSKGELDFKLPLPLVFIISMGDTLMNGSNGNNGLLYKVFGGYYYMLKVNPLHFIDLIMKNGAYDYLKREKLIQKDIMSFVKFKGQQLNVANQGTAELLQKFNNIPYIVYVHFNSELNPNMNILTNGGNDKTILAKVLLANDKYNKEMRDFFRKEFHVDSYTPMINKVYNNNPDFSETRKIKSIEDYLYYKKYSTPTYKSVDYDNLTVDFGNNPTPEQYVALFGKSTYLDIGLKDKTLKNELLTKKYNIKNDFSLIYNLEEKYNDDKVLEVPNKIQKKFLNTHRNQLISINLLDKIRKPIALKQKNIYKYLYTDLVIVENIIKNKQLKGNSLKPKTSELLYAQNKRFLENNIDIYFKNYYPESNKYYNLDMNSDKLDEDIKIKNEFSKEYYKMNEILEKYIKDLSLSLANGNGNEFFYETKIRAIINNQVENSINVKYNQTNDRINKLNDIVRNKLKHIIEEKKDLEWTRSVKKLKREELVNGNKFQIESIKNIESGNSMTDKIVHLTFYIGGILINILTEILITVSSWLFAIVISIIILELLLFLFNFPFLIIVALWKHSFKDAFMKTLSVVMYYFIYPFMILLMSKLLLSYAPLIDTISYMFGDLGGIIQIVFIFFIFWFMGMGIKKLEEIFQLKKSLNIMSKINDVQKGVSLGVGGATMAGTGMAVAGSAKVLDSGVSKGKEQFIPKNPTNNEVAPQVQGNNIINKQNDINVKINSNKNNTILDEFGKAIRGHNE